MSVLYIKKKVPFFDSSLAYGTRALPLNSFELCTTFVVLSVLLMLNFLLFSFRKTLQFQWTGAETSTFLIEANISGEQIMALIFF